MLSNMRCAAIIALCSALAAGGTYALADVPQIEMITVDQSPDPNPALFGGTVTAVLTVHLKDPTTGDEIQPPPDTSYLWSCLSVTAPDDVTPVPTAAGVSLVGAGPTETVSATFAPTTYTTLPVDYQIALLVVVSNPAWLDVNGNPITLTGTATVDAFFSNISVSFTPNPVRTGYFVMTGMQAPMAYRDIETPVVAQVSSMGPVNKVNLSVEGQLRAAISGDISNAASGSADLNFNVAGVSPTPGNVPGGDTSIVATDVNGNRAGSVNTVVVIPSTCGEDRGPVTLKNTYAPANYPGFPGTWFLFTTTASSPVTITVYDQFGAVLDAMYDGSAVVDEDIPPFTDLWGRLTKEVNGAIELPDMVFASGVKTDQNLTNANYPSTVAAPGQESGWPNFLLTLSSPNGVDGDPLLSTNAFALQMNLLNVKSSVTTFMNQSITVAGHGVSPVWQQQTTYSSVGFPVSISELGGS